MPILEVELVRAPQEAPREPQLSTLLANAAGRVFGLDSGRVWVRYRELPADGYAENDIDEPPHPAFVSVLRRELPGRDALALEASALATALAPLLGRPIELVHVIYEPPGAGRVAFGGRLV